MAVCADDVTNSGMNNTILIAALSAKNVEMPTCHNTIGTAVNAGDVDVSEIQSMNIMVVGVANATRLQYTLLLMAHAMCVASEHALPEPMTGGPYFPPTDAHTVAAKNVANATETEKSSWDPSTG